MPYAFPPPPPIRSMPYVPPLKPGELTDGLKELANDVTTAGQRIVTQVTTMPLKTLQQLKATLLTPILQLPWTMMRKMLSPQTRAISASKVAQPTVPAFPIPEGTANRNLRNSMSPLSLPGMRQALNQGADPSLIIGSTPILHVMVKEQKWDAVRLLLDHGASPAKVKDFARQEGLLKDLYREADQELARAETRMRTAR